MKLWKQVCETNPQITKQVKQRGGFTAVCAQAQLKRATELWGTYGDKWGVKRLDWGMIGIEGSAPLEATLDAIFYAPGIEFEISTDMAYKPGNDSRKKLLTDLTTKSLSKLGFNSDVFEGKFDDNKYVAEMNKKFKNDKNLNDKPTPKKPTKAQQAIIEKVAITLEEDLDGKGIDRAKLTRLLFAQKGDYPKDKSKITLIANWIIGNNWLQQLTGE